MTWEKVVLHDDGPAPVFLFFVHSASCTYRDDFQVKTPTNSCKYRTTVNLSLAFYTKTRVSGCDLLDS